MTVALRINQRDTHVYMIDISRGGLKIARPDMWLTLNSKVELMIGPHGSKLSFEGTVAREDRMEYIDRIKKSGNVYFIKVDDERYARLVTEYFHL